MKDTTVRNAIDLRKIGSASSGSALKNPVMSNGAFNTIYASANIDGAWKIVIKTSDQALTTNEQVQDNELKIPLDANGLYFYHVSVYFVLSDPARWGSDVAYSIDPSSLPAGCQFGGFWAYTVGVGYCYTGSGSLMNYGAAGIAHFLIGEGGTPDFTLTVKAGSYILYSKVGEFVP